MSAPGKLLLSAKAIDRRVHGLAADIRRHYKGKPLTVIGLMNGSLFFLADLLRQLPLETEIECWKVSSYRGKKTTGRLNGLAACKGSYRGRHVLVVDDILDTGRTLRSVRNKLLAGGAKDIRICVLLVKKTGLPGKIKADWTGFEIKDRFVIGYGLDLDQKYRLLPMIRVLN